MNQEVRFLNRQFWLTFLFIVSIFFVNSERSFRSLRIAELKNYSIDPKRDIYNTFDSEAQNDQGIPVDPFDLMNRLQQAGAMNDATTPSDALDEALNSFNESEYGNVPIE